ncbi:Glycoside hydrolase family 3 protein [Mycena indigotica]|uniref:xylan 1,4-beta-xylosidase n=1 Tax=Mycena indigotica TaxID=2126181 RepID=A0A8H6VZ98_9AGAR|nr:Glycoside hydrolase family 3 protein [Mycena indigotica]KAF7299252.1 Glycoside hydrolase family 3 protein [Mycena indigotica]
MKGSQLVVSILSALVRVHAAFPDCTKAPLLGTTVCDTTKPPTTRAKSLIAMFTTEEMIANTPYNSPGVSRLGLPAYTWWSEALVSDDLLPFQKKSHTKELQHGVAFSPGVSFADSGEFSFATSFPENILLGATFDDALVEAVANVISTEARAFNNVGRAGLDFFTPNINPFRDPRWGRGLETPGEDSFRDAQYVFSLVKGLQGGINPSIFKVVADCKHFAGYDLENWEGNSRFSFNAVISQQDMAEYYLQPFQSCVRDAKVGSVMCSYNAVNGIPSCANTWLLQTVLRDFWGFDDERFVVSDCDAIGNFIDHDFSPDLAHAAASGMNAGTDIDCGSTYPDNLGDALSAGLVNTSTIARALTRQYTTLVRLGYFDPPASQPFRQLTFAAVNAPSSQALAYQAAIEGIALLKNDGTLPLSKGKKVAIIGPWGNATTQMQGNYQGEAPFLISPLAAAQTAGLKPTFAAGAAINSSDTSGFAAAIAAARSSDVILYFGGIDTSIEAEGHDRDVISWPQTQLDLISQLETLGKPLIITQFGAGQIDSAALKSSKNVSAIIWGGYPGQSGGTAVIDIITGKVSPSGRLPVTQYPADFIHQVPMTDMSMRPSSTNPGRTYKWFTGTPTFEFGTGLSFGSFALSFAGTPKATYDIQDLVSGARGATHLDLGSFDTFHVDLHNKGTVASDFIVLMFVKTTAGPAPFPNKSLVGYTRAKDVKSGQISTASVTVTLGSIARTDESGTAWLFPGDYSLLVDVPTAMTHNFRLTGRQAKISSLPPPPS